MHLIDHLSARMPLKPNVPFHLARAGGAPAPPSVAFTHTHTQTIHDERFVHVDFGQWSARWVERLTLSVRGSQPVEREQVICGAHKKQKAIDGC